MFAQAHCSRDKMLPQLPLEAGKERLMMSLYHEFYSTCPVILFCSQNFLCTRGVQLICCKCRGGNVRDISRSFEQLLNHSCILILCETFLTGFQFSCGCIVVYNSGSVMVSNKRVLLLSRHSGDGQRAGCPQENHPLKHFLGFQTEKSLELVTFNVLCKITCFNEGNMMVTGAG